MELNLTEADLNLLKEKGISEATLEKQLADFRNGFPYLRIVRPASTDDESILTIDEETARKALTRWENTSPTAEKYSNSYLPPARHRACSRSCSHS